MGNSNATQNDSEHLGYRVLGVQPQSPAAKGGLVSFFDFIVAANGVPLKSLDTTFIELIKASEDKPLPLNVYNIKNHSIREVILVPSKKWPGEGMLGVTIRFDSYFEAEEQMCHVLEVEVNSPAELAGLQPYKDYLLGTAEKAFKDTDILFAELNENLDKPVEFYVYNTDTDEVRTVVIMPSKDWGGDGILGANVAHGFLHILPASCCNSIGSSSEGTVNKIMNSPFGHNEATVADIYNSPTVSSDVLSAGVVPPYHGAHSNAENDPNAVNQQAQNPYAISPGNVVPNNYLFKSDQVSPSNTSPPPPHPSNHTIPIQTYQNQVPTTHNQQQQQQPHLIHVAAMPASAGDHRHHIAASGAGVVGMQQPTN